MEQRDFQCCLSNAATSGCVATRYKKRHQNHRGRTVCNIPPRMHSSMRTIAHEASQILPWPFQLREGDLVIGGINPLPCHDDGLIWLLSFPLHRVLLMCILLFHVSPSTRSLIHASPIGFEQFLLYNNIWMKHCDIASQIIGCTSIPTRLLSIRRGRLRNRTESGITAFGADLVYI